MTPVVSSVVSLVTATILLGACATAEGPGGTKRYGLSELDVFEAVGRGEGRDALAYYEARASKLAGGGTWGKADAARTYAAAAVVSQYLGLYQKAVRHGLTAVKLLEKLPDHEQVVQGRMILCNLLGFTQAQIGDLDEARRQFERCLELAGAPSSDAMFSLSWSATAWTGLAAVAFLQGDYATAIDSGKKSVGLREDFLARLEGTRQWNRQYTDIRERTTWIHAFTFLIVGRAEWELKRLDEADASYRRALGAAKSVGMSQLELLARAALVQVTDARGDEAGAEREAQEVRVQSQRFGLGVFFTTLMLSGKGARNAERGRHEVALQNFQEAMQTVEDVRSRLEESVLRGLFLEDKQVIYHGAVGSALSLGRVEAAFGFAERGRARAFLDLLGTHTALGKGTASPLVAEEERVTARLSDARAAVQLVQTPEAPVAVRSGGTAVRDIAVGEFEALMGRIRQESPEQASLMTVEPVTLGEVQKLLPEGIALLEYLVTEQETIVWVVERGRVEAVRLAVPRATLVAEVRSLRSAIAETAAIQAVERHARALYERLIAPVRAHVRRDRLLIVPHDVLHYVPFAALRSPEGRWLVEDYTVATLPSASVLKFLGGKGINAPASALVVGNPDLGPSLGLPFAEREARMVGEQLPGATILLRGEATKSRVKTLIGTAGILHFATHGDLRAREPLGSALLLTPEGQDDGRLEVRDIFRLELNARLVVLSACETGLGRLSRGDELVGLQRAFLYAGAPAVVTTLWKVEDRATYELMREFYVRLKDGGPAAALVAAQRQTMRTFPHPFAWAAFGLTGLPWSSEVHRAVSQGRGG
jgi:CHAT domain-containing protein/tetratricopeptide (TPR) repeat protein